VAGVAVGGLTVDQARSALQAAFDQPLRFVFKKKRWQVTPQELGARIYVNGAVSRALAAPPGATVDAVVRIRGQALRDYVSYLQTIFNRPAKDSTLRLKKLRPFLTRAREGVKVERQETLKAIVRALVRNERAEPLELPARVVAPKKTPETFGPIVVIRRESKRLYYYDGARLVRRFGVATGQASYPTPLGRWSVVVKQRNPWWYPPDSDWAAGARPIPPGPGNPLGTRWMGLSAPLVGIHGTPDAASIGYSASHGCIRMRIPEAEWLFQRIEIETPVFIVRA
jgi:lipoprotein-anchoring transpeptidase ErfK/SrfK